MRDGIIFTALGVLMLALNKPLSRDKDVIEGWYRDTPEYRHSPIRAFFVLAWRGFSTLAFWRTYAIALAAIILGVVLLIRAAV